MKENKVKAAEIYKEVIKMLGYADDDSTKRNLRNKMNFLLEQVALRKVMDFKDGKNLYIPCNDAAIIRNLLMLAISDDGMIVDWFNGNIDTNDAEMCVLLYMQLKEPVLSALMTCETDEVTVDEWMAAISGVLNYDMAEKTLKMKRKLEDFRVRTLVMNNTVRNGDIIVENEDGSRYYGLERMEITREIPVELLDKIVENLYVQGDYFDVMHQIMDRMIIDAEEKAVPAIEIYALAKNVAECDKAVELIATSDDSIVSEYYPWFNKIANFLKNHPDECKRIEDFANTDNLEEFFRMK